MNAIAQLRKDANLTQTEVAKAVGLERTSVAKWETGDSAPKIPMLPLLGELYGVTVCELVSAIIGKDCTCRQRRKR